jgi:hypothetical protein
MGLGDGDAGDELGAYYPSSSQNNYGRVIEQSAQHEEEGEEPYVLAIFPILMGSRTRAISWVASGRQSIDPRNDRRFL